MIHLSNDMLTNVVHLLNSFCFCWLIDAYPQWPIRTKWGNIFGQWIPCHPLNIMAMSFQNLMNRTWREQTNNLVYDNRAPPHTLQECTPLFMSHIMQELSTDPEIRNAPSLDHCKSKTSLRWNLSSKHLPTNKSSR